MLIRTATLLLLLASSTSAQTPSTTPPAPANAPAQAESQPPAKAPAPSAPEVQTSEESHPTYRVGLGLGLISIPRPVSIELQVKLWDWFGLGASFTYLPSFISDLLLHAFNIHNVTVTSTSWEGLLRIYPFRGSFYLGANVGVGTVTANSTGNLPAATAEVTNAFIAPRLGWLWIWGSGFALGLDAGVQIPLGQATITFNPPQSNVKETRDAANQIANLPLPVLNFRIGYYF